MTGGQICSNPEVKTDTMAGEIHRATERWSLRGGRVITRGPTGTSLGVTHKIEVPWTGGGPGRWPKHVAPPRGLQSKYLRVAQTMARTRLYVPAQNCNEALTKTILHQKCHR